MERIGILGGTFDPPHIGHLLLADTAAHQLQLDQVRFCPVGQPVHKETMTPAEHRVAMTELAIADDPRFVLDTTDVDRPPPHFTADLLPLIFERQPASYFLLMGGDSLRDLPTWDRPDAILDQVKLGVLHRPGAEFDIETLMSRFSALENQLHLIKGPSIHISSTMIRELTHQGGALRYLLDPAVVDYIQLYNLYTAP